MEDVTAFLTGAGMDSDDDADDADDEGDRSDNEAVGSCVFREGFGFCGLDVNREWRAPGTTAPRVVHAEGRRTHECIVDETQEALQMKWKPNMCGGGGAPLQMRYPASCVVGVGPTALR